MNAALSLDALDSSLVHLVPPSSNKAAVKERYLAPQTLLMSVVTLSLIYRPRVELLRGVDV
jgi:hypothetical protein